MEIKLFQRRYGITKTSGIYTEAWKLFCSKETAFYHWLLILPFVFLLLFLYTYLLGSIPVHSCMLSLSFEFSFLSLFLTCFSLLADLQYNCCDIPEEAWTEVDSEVVYASYIPGSIIWAKQYGYPW